VPREYNTAIKIVETFRLAEQSGINMIQVSSGSLDIVGRSRKERGGKLQMKACVGVDRSDPARVKARTRELVLGFHRRGEDSQRRENTGGIQPPGPGLD
jgi:hypothetical protein